MKSDPKRCAKIAEMMGWKRGSSPEGLEYRERNNLMHSSYELHWLNPERSKMPPHPPCFDTDMNAAFEVRDWACQSSEAAALRFWDALGQAVCERLTLIPTAWQVVKYMNAADICDAACPVADGAIKVQEAQDE